MKNMANIAMNRKLMRLTLKICLFNIGIVLFFYQQGPAEPNESARMRAEQISANTTQHWTTADHSKFEALNKDFESGKTQPVAAAYLPGTGRRAASPADDYRTFILDL